MPVALVASRTTTLLTDNDGDGFADAGDVLRHVLTITNTGNTAALNVVVNDLLGGSTETGLMNISPIALDDAFTAVGNTTLRVGTVPANVANIGTGPSSMVVGNLLSNDVGSTTVGVGALAGDDITGFTITTVTNGTSTLGGTFNIFADGSFNYISDDGDTGVDTFTYTIRDAGIDGIAGNADDTTSSATVSIALSGQVWYVDSAAAPGTGTGTSANPFGSLSSATAADSSGDYIYIKGSVTGTAVLETGEHLIGTGSSLDVAGFHLADAGARSTISGSSGFTVTLAGGGTGNNEIAGINIVSTGGAANHGLTGTSFGNLTINNTTIDASGQALVLSTGAIVSGSTGLVSTDSDGGTNNVSLTGVTGTLALGGGALSGATGTAFNVSGGSVTTTYSGNVSQASASQALVNVTGGHSGTLTFSTGTLSATNGTGLQFDSADGTYNFNGTNTLNGGDAGIDITNGSGGAFSFSSNSSINNPTGIAFNVNGGAGNIDYNGSISKNTDGQAISVQNHTGGTVSFDGTASSTGTSDGINLATNIGATINFTQNLTLTTSSSGTTAFNATGGGTVNVSGASVAINSGAGAGVNINNTGVNFTGGTLDIDTTSGVGFAAAGGGTITVTGANNSINSTSATALNVNGTTIGASGLNFHDISSGNNTAAADPVNGIILTNTGSSGGLLVTGDAGGVNNGSGGTIQQTTGDGIVLTNTQNVRLGYMNITGNLGDGIGGSTVNGFVLNRMNVTLNGDDAATDESGINITELTGSSSGGSRPTSISNSVFTNNEEFQVQVTNTSGTLTDFQFTSNTVSSNGSSGTIGNLVSFMALGTANMAITATGGTYTGAAPLTATGLHIDHSGTSGTMTATVNGGTFTNNNVAVSVSAAQGGNLDFDIIGTTSTGNRSHGLNLFVAASSTGTVTGSFLNNVIGTVGVPGSGSNVGFGIRVQNEGSTATANPVTVLISGNTLREFTSFAAININQGIAGQSLSRTINATITNNTISDVDDSRAIIFQQNNSTNATSAGIANLDIHGNVLNLATIAGNVGDGTVIRIRQLDANGGDVNIVQTQATAAATATELDDANGFNNSGKISISGSVDYGQPAPPMPLMVSPDSIPIYAWDSDPANRAALASSPPQEPDGMGAGDVSSDTPVQPDPDPSPTSDPATTSQVVVDDGVLSLTELALIVEAAIGRWEAAGATESQLAAMRAVLVSVSDLGGLTLGESAIGSIVIDTDAAGWRWFVDNTPGDDTEYARSGVVLVATDPMGHAGTRIDLLTVIMHELGHQIGLTDIYASGEADELMYGMVAAGQRRLPGADDAARADGTPVSGAFALSPVNIGTIPAATVTVPNRTVTVQWDSTVNALANNQVIQPFNNTSSISGSNFATLFSNTEALGASGTPTPSFVVLDSLTLGGTIWNDNGAGGGIANNGLKDGTEAGIDGVTVSLFADADNNDVPDTPGTPLITGVLTAGGGNYSFALLAPGNYIVRVDADNFTGGGALVGRLTSTGGPDPDNNTDNDDNGVNGAGGIVVSQAITLSQNGETTLDGTGQLDINNTLDFGFMELNDAPVNSLGGTIGTGEDAIDAWLSGMSIADPDAGSSDIDVTFHVDNGILDIRTDVVGGIVLADIVGGADDSDTITVRASLAEINATLTASNGLTYSPDLNFNGSDTLTVTSNDRGFTGADPGLTGDGTSEEDIDTRTITVSASDDAPVAQPDAVTTPENAVGTGDLFADNGSGADVDVDGPPLMVAAIDGSGANVATEITLASGAKLTVLADGSYSYDPDGQFNYLISSATATATGAVNDEQAETFTYALAGGNTVTVTMTVTGVDGAGDQLHGDGTGNTINGTIGNDFVNVSQGGDDTANGGAGNDIIYYGTAFTAADQNDGGPGTRDVVVLQGNYTLTLGADDLVNVEYLSLQSGTVTKFGQSGANSYDYAITTVDENVAAGQTLVVNAQSLQAGETFTFDGSAETDGKFLVFGGRDTDDLTGGDGDDIFSFEEPRWNATDTIDGGLGQDAVVLSFGSGLNTIVFGAAQFTSIEAISVNHRFATDPSQIPSYALVLNNGNVAAGATLIVNGQSLLATQTISIDGSAETDGRLRLFGGAGDDVLIGGANDDEMTGKAGADLFTYLAAAQSTVALPDEILDLEVGIDKIDLSAIDAIAGGGNDAFSFIGSAAFSNTAGELRATFDSLNNVWQVEGDTDGIGGADFLILVTGTLATPLTSNEFVL